MCIRDSNNSNNNNTNNNLAAVVCSFKADWVFAMKYAEKLFVESRWSRSTYACLQASFLLMTDDDSTKDHVTYLMQYDFVLFAKSCFGFHKYSSGSDIAFAVRLVQF